MSRQLEKLQKYYEGIINGVTRYAHWKDGVQYVGTCGKTLKEAIEEIQQECQEMVDEMEEDDRILKSDLMYSRVGRDAMRRG